MSSVAIFVCKLVDLQETLELSKNGDSAGTFEGRMIPISGDGGFVTSKGWGGTSGSCRSSNPTTPAFKAKLTNASNNIKTRDSGLFLHSTSLPLDSNALALIQGALQLRAGSSAGALAKLGGSRYLATASEPYDTLVIGGGENHSYLDSLIVSEASWYS